MRNLVPKYILEKYKGQEFSGEFEAITMFIDISGFTAMTETLMNHGNVGAEELSDILKFLFTSAVDLVYENGGFITTFAGDAFTAIFKTDLIEEKNILSYSVLDTAFLINKFFEENKSYKSKYGEFEFGVKVGLSRGTVNWGILGDEDRLTYFFRGDAVDNCAKSESYAVKGDIVFDEFFYNNKKLKDIPVKELQSGYKKLVISKMKDAKIDKRNGEISKAKSILSNKENEKISKLFTGVNEYNFPSGEFRNVVSIFISFDESIKLQLLIKSLFKNIKLFGASQPKLDFGDKGGNILLFIGTPKSYDNNEKRALDLILNIIHEIGTVNARKIRAGITTGIVYSGFNGAEKREEFTCLGNIVNQSARFMMKAEWGEFLLDKYIVNNYICKKLYDFKFIGDKNYKGVKNEVATYSLVGNKDSSSLSKNFKYDFDETEFIGKMIGRKKELLQLESLASRVIAGCEFGGIVYLEGEAGTGKSRLIWELKKKLILTEDEEEDDKKISSDKEKLKYKEKLVRRGVDKKSSNSNKIVEKRFTVTNWITLQCDEIVQKSFNPFIHFFNDLFDQSNKNSLQKNKKNFSSKYKLLIKEISKISDNKWNKRKNDRNNSELLILKRELVRTRSFLGAMLGHYWTNSLYDKLDAKARYENTVISITSFFKVLTIFNPIIIQLENSQWIDEDSKNLIQTIFNETKVSNFSILFLSVNRFNLDGSNIEVISCNNDNNNEESRNNKNSNIHNTRIKFDFFDKKSVSKLLKNIIFNEKFKPNGSLNKILIPQETVDTIFENSSGNPFYVEQIVRYLIENDFINRESLEIANKDIKIPSSINAIIIARIDKLTNELSDLVKTVSVLGREFSVRILSEVLRKDNSIKRSDPRLQKILKEELFEGVEDDLWTSASELEYIFKHTIIRDVAYEIQLKKRIKELHKFAAISIEEVYKDNLVNYYSELAYHFDKAEDIDNSLKYYEKAGNHAKDNFMNEKALEYFKRWMDIAEVEYGISEDMVITNQNREFVGRYIDILSLGYANILHITGKKENLEFIYKKGLKVAEKIGDIERKSTVLYDIAGYYDEKNDTKKAAIYFQKAFELLTKYLTNNKNKKRFAGVVTGLGLLKWKAGNTKEALSLLERSLLICKEINDSKEEARVLGNIGLIHDFSGNFELALKNYSKQLIINKNLKDKVGISFTIGNMGVVYYFQGKFEDALKSFKMKFRLSKEIGNKREISIALGNIGNIYFEEKKYKKAMSYQMKRLRISEAMNDLDGISYSIVNIGNIYKEEKKYDLALEYYNKGLIDVNTENIKYLLTEFYMEIADLYYRMNNFSKAKENNEVGLKIAKEINQADCLTRCEELQLKLLKV